jgi:hypothetical protein
MTWIRERAADGSTTVRLDLPAAVIEQCIAARDAPAIQRAAEPPEFRGTLTKGRRATVEWANDIPIENARWLWNELLPMRSLTLFAGREGIGKSTFAYQVIADVTRGKLDGEFLQQPRTVLVVATEDSWKSTIAPRLKAAGADLSRVGKISVAGTDGSESALDISIDLAALEEQIMETGAALVVLDPLMSRLGTKVDSHKDAEVRSALEPLTAMADRTDCAIVGLIHLNKGAHSNLLDSIMASKAFAAVARSVLFFATDNRHPEITLVGQAKSNLGPKFRGVMAYRIETAWVQGTTEKVKASRIARLDDEPDRSIDDAVGEQHSANRGPTLAEKAAGWIEAYLHAQPGQRAARKDVLEAAMDYGFTSANINTGFRMLSERKRVESKRANVEHGPATWVLMPVSRAKAQGA